MTHKLKTSHLLLGFLFALVPLGFLACAGSANEHADEEETQSTEALAPPDPRMPLLDSAYNDLLRRCEADEPTDSIRPLLTDSSLLWIRDIENAAATESRAILENRPFNEELSIVTYRTLQRDNRLAGVRKDSLLYLSAGPNGLVHAVRTLELGPFQIRNNRGSRGLATSPLVPIIFFQWVDNRWLLDVVATMPVITRGMETVALKKNWTNSHTILYWLESSYRNQLKNPVDSTLLDPVN